MPDPIMLTNPQCHRFFVDMGLPPPADQSNLDEYWAALPWDDRETSAWTLESLRDSLGNYLSAQAGRQGDGRLSRLDIKRGQGKDGTPERFDLTLLPGQVVCIVGPTGSGKSRLLGDIECLAQGDTPTRRIVLIDGQPPHPDMRFSGEGKIVAQITQNMNFVMDLCVADFLHLHAESRLLDDCDDAVARVMDAAISMAGEPFSATTPLTQLSGGQSRALMIADAAYLSPKPVVLIDEIENAGVDRTRALKLFVEKGKIVLLSTHDPLLALSGDRRLVIRGGMIADVIETTDRERGFCQALADYDNRLSQLREALRHGHDLDQAAAGWL